MLMLHLKLMRKKESTYKQSKPKSSGSAVKKVSSKAKTKPKDNKTQQCFIFLEGQYYVAASKTERRTYHLFEEKMKTVTTNSTIPNHSTTISPEPIDLRQYVKSLSKAEKQRLLQDLEQDIDLDKEPEDSVEEHTEEKLDKLKARLEHIRSELMQGWEEQIGRINNRFDNQQISLEQKNEKIRLVENIRNHKLAMIDYTRVLFEKIMREDSEVEINKQEQLEHIINSLNSISSLRQHSEQDTLQHPFEPYLPHINSDRSPRSSPQHPKEQPRSAERAEVVTSQEEEAVKSQEEKRAGEREGTQTITFSKEHLRLDIRLDEVEFGKDHYEDEQTHTIEKPVSRENQQPKQDKSGSQHINIQDNEQVNEKERSAEKQPSKEKDQQEVSIERKRLEEEFLCFDEQSPDAKITIPLLMTKDRLEQLEFEKSSRQIEALNVALKNRHAFQVSEIQPETAEHFTTLLDVNNFVVEFYEFVMHCYLKQAIEGLNLAYGKSAVDKLFQIRNEGYVPDYDNNNILPEELLSQYHKDVMLSRRKIPEFERLHNRAIFHAFNAGLNVYRPYYELEGEVFPWNTSEKGLTFYEINEDNIEEVFEKSKMKVLEYCASLCGIMPNCQLTTGQAQKTLAKRNEDNYDRILKTEVNEKFGDWYLKMLNFEALARMNLAEEIIEQEMFLFVRELLLLQR